MKSIQRLFIALLVAMATHLSHAQTDGRWLGGWSLGEPGARTYQKIRISQDTLRFADGGRMDLGYFPSEKSKVWCKANYSVVSRSKGDSFPGEGATAIEADHKLGRKWEVVMLELAPNTCGAQKYLQMAFPSDYDAASVMYFDEEHQWAGTVLFHHLMKANGQVIE